MKRVFAPCLIAAAMLSGCAMSPSSTSLQITDQSSSSTSIHQRIHRLLTGGKTPIKGDSITMAATRFIAERGDTVLGLLRRAGAPETLFYDLPKADQGTLANLSPGDELAVFQDASQSYVGLAASSGEQWRMARWDAGAYQLRDGMDLSTPTMKVHDLPLSSTLAATLTSLSMDQASRDELAALLARGLPTDDLPDGWLRLRLEHRLLDGVDMGKPTLMSAALSDADTPTLMVRYRSRVGDAGYYTGDGERLEPDWIAKPVKGKYRVTSEFNPRRRHPITGRVRPHNGRDFAAKRGTPVVAATAGTVVHAGRRGSWGRLVVLAHGDGMQTRYAHLSSIPGDLSPGDTVSRGQRVGRVGTSGMSTGPHLHFEIHQRGLAKNPATFEPGTATPALVALDDQDRQFFEQYRDMETTSLAHLPKRGKTGLLASASLQGVGGPDEADGLDSTAP